MRFALVAGETSGDLLGAALIRALREKFPDATFYGMAGPQMRAAGCEAIEDISALSVMGLTEVLRHLPRLLKLRARLVERFAADRPDAVIAIDAPDFTLGLERRLRARGLRTVHVVSPSVWAWRKRRIHGIKKAVDLMLCLFPFELDIYREHGVPAEVIGHPLADELDAAVTSRAGKRVLGLPDDGPAIALLPGSRHGEVSRLAPVFAATASRLALRRPAARFIVPVARPDLREQIEAAFRPFPNLRVHLLDGQSREAMQAADAVLLASGTATLECLLLGRPMVVAYRTSAFTAWLLLDLGLLKIGQVSLPNLLSPEAAVPEYLQNDATPETLGAAVLRLIEDPAARHRQIAAFDLVRGALRQGAGGRAAQAIADLVKK